MFDALRSLIADLTQADPGGAEFDENDLRVAAAALLFHIADVDGEISAAERRRLKEIVTQEFGLDPGETHRLLAAAQKSEAEAVDLFQFTHVLKRGLDAEGRLKVVEMLWRMALADGKVDEFEENTVWRVAELLGVSNRDRVLLRQRVTGEEAVGTALGVGAEGAAPADPDRVAAGPWSSKAAS